MMAQAAGRVAESHAVGEALCMAVASFQRPRVCTN
jgi:hypothetical protein